MYIIGLHDGRVVEMTEKEFLEFTELDDECLFVYANGAFHGDNKEGLEIYDDRVTLYGYQHKPIIMKFDKKISDKILSNYLSTKDSNRLILDVKNMFKKTFESTINTYEKMVKTLNAVMD